LLRRLRRRLSFQASALLSSQPERATINEIKAMPRKRELFAPSDLPAARGEAKTADTADSSEASNSA
jgi:hypothetical protein